MRSTIIQTPPLRTNRIRKSARARRGVALTLIVVIAAGIGAAALNLI